MHNVGWRVSIRLAAVLTVTALVAGVIGVIPLPLPLGAMVRPPIAGATTPTATVTTQLTDGSWATNPSSSIQTLNSPRGIAVDPSNNIYVTEWSTGAIKKIAPAGVVTTLTTNAVPNSYDFLAFAAGSLWVTDFAANALVKVDPNTGATQTIASAIAQYGMPSGVAVTPDGKTAYVAGIKDVFGGYGGPTVYQIDTATGASADIHWYWGGVDAVCQAYCSEAVGQLSMGPDGTVLMSTGWGKSFQWDITRYTAAGWTYVANIPQMYRGLAIDQVSGRIYASNEGAGCPDSYPEVMSYDLSGNKIKIAGHPYSGPAYGNFCNAGELDGTVNVPAPSDLQTYDPTVPKLNGPINLAVGPDGAIYTAEDGSGYIRRIVTSGMAPVAWPPKGGPLTPAETNGGGSPSEGCPCHRWTMRPVDTATGNFWHTFTDLAIPGRGVPIKLTRTYNTSSAGTDSPFGFGWTDSYNLSLSVNGSTATLNEETGSQIPFTLTGSTWAPNAPRVAATLVHNGDGTWTLTRHARQIFTFDSSGNLTAERDLNGYTTAVTRPNGSTLVVTDPAGRTLTMNYTGNHVTGLADNASPARTMTFTYDGSGNLTDVIDVGGGHSQFSYDGSHRMLTMREPKYFGDTTTTPSPVTTNHYDASGRVDWQTDPLGQQTTFDYTSIPGSTRITDPKGNVTVDAYQYGELTSEAKGYGTPQVATWTYGYDPTTVGVTSVTDPNGHTTISTYDAQGNVLTKTDALNHTTTSTYDALNDLLTVKDPNNVTTTMVYDAAGNLQSTSTPLVGSVPLKTQLTGYAYGDAGHPGDVTAVTDPNGKVWPASYDGYGNLASSTDPLGNKTMYCYDRIGRRTETVTPKGTAGFTCPATPPGTPTPYTTLQTYNAYGQPLVATDPLNHSSSRTYDGNGNLRIATDADGHPTTYTFDPNNQLTQILRADGTTLRNDYWPDGSLKSQYDGANRATAYAYDPVGRLSAVTDPDNRTTTYGYDGAGNRISKQDPGGNCAGAPATACTTYGYDAANELISTTYSDGVTPNVTSIGYDADGQRTSMIEGAGGTGNSSWVWDSLHRMTSSTNGAGAIVGYGYDLKGQLTSITYPGATGTVTRGFDDAGRLHTVSDWLGHTTTFNNDADSALTSEVYPNTTTATFTPDGADRLMTISDAPTASPNSPFMKFTYGRDNANQLTSVTSTGVPADNHTWTYSSLNQLKTDTAAAQPYGYDAADNLTQFSNGTAQTFDPANQLTGTSNVSIVGTPTGGGDSGTTNSLNITLPAGTTTNDIIVVAATVPYSKSVSTPSGYTLMGPYTSGTTSTSAKVYVFWKRAVSTDTSVSLSFGQKYAKSATVTSYRGLVTSGSPVDVSSNGSTAGGTSVAAPSVTTTVAGDRLVMIQGAEAATAAGTWTAPSGMSELVQKQGGTSIATGMADQTLGAAGATGTRVATFSNSAQLVGVLLALKPALTSYGFETRGNRTTVTSPTGAVTTLGYDQANRLTSYAATATYKYNGDGLRTSKTVSGTTTNETWDLAEGLPLLLVDGTTNYVYGPGGLPLEQIAGSTVLYYHQDQLGSTRALTNATGGVVATYTYDPYGKLAGSTGSAANPFGFAGQYTDAESGMQYLRARYYDPSTAGFVNRDPAVVISGVAYGYANDNPLNGTDPTGLFCLLGHVHGNHGPCRGKNIKNDLATAGVVVGTAALVVGTIAAPEVVLPLVGTVSTESLGVGLGITSTAIGAYVTAADCRHAVDAQCVIDGVGTALGAASVLGSYAARTGSALAGNAEELAKFLRGVSNLGFGLGSSLYGAAGLFGGQLGLTSDGRCRS